MKFCCSSKKQPLDLEILTPTTTDPCFVWNHWERWFRTPLFSKPRGGMGHRLEVQGQKRQYRGEGSGCVRAKALIPAFQDRFAVYEGPETSSGKRLPLGVPCFLTLCMSFARSVFVQGSTRPEVHLNGESVHCTSSDRPPPGLPHHTLIATPCPGVGSKSL